MGEQLHKENEKVAQEAEEKAKKETEAEKQKKKQQQQKKDVEERKVVQHPLGKTVTTIKVKRKKRAQGGCKRCPEGWGRMEMADRMAELLRFGKCPPCQPLSTNKFK